MHSKIFISLRSVFVRKVILFIFDKNKSCNRGFFARVEHDYGVSIKLLFFQSLFEVRCLEAFKKAKQDNAICIGVKYPLEDSDDYDVLSEFLEKAFVCSKKNIWYFPKPNLNTSTNNFALFCIYDNWNLEHLEVEIGYRKNITSRVLRNKLHNMLRESREVDVMAPKSLLNLAYGWEYFDIKKNREKDLTDRATYFYPCPSNITLEITNVCNLSCIMCPFHSNVYKKTHRTDVFNTQTNMQFDVVKDAVKFIVKAQKNGFLIALDFSAVGEPLMHDKAIDFIRYAKRKGVKYVCLTTNLLLLDSQVSCKLLDSGLDHLCVSIDGATQDTYNKIRKGGDYLVVKDNLRHFIELARNENSDIEISLNCVLVGDSNNEKEQYTQEWYSYRDYIKTITFSTVRKFDKENGLELIDCSLKYNIPNRGGGGVCSSPWGDNIVVTPDGKCTGVCCPMNEAYGWSYFDFGSVEKDGLKGIWDSKSMKTLREENLSQKFNLFAQSCLKCERRLFEFNRFAHKQMHEEHKS